MKYLVTGFPYVSGPRHKISLLVFPRFPREGGESRRGKTDIPGQHRRLLIMKVLSDQYLHYKVDLRSMLANYDAVSYSNSELLENRKIHPPFVVSSIPK